MAEKLPENALKRTNKLLTAIVVLLAIGLVFDFVNHINLVNMTNIQGAVAQDQRLGFDMILKLLSKMRIY